MGLDQSGATGGRPTRSQRTRAAVVGALHQLIRDGEPEPGARRIAERAGVSVRSVFAHFASLEDLHAAVAERVADEVVALLRPIDTSLPLAERVADLCAQRSRVNEQITPFRRAAAAREATSPALAAARAAGRAAARDQVLRVFDAELRGLGPGARRRRAATVDALLSGEAWDILRTVHGLTPDDATSATAESVLSLLAPVPTEPAPETGAVARTDAGDRAAAAPRPVDADRARAADTDARIDRLVAAIEAGTPPDLLAPRLRELREARSAASADATP